MLAALCPMNAAAPAAVATPPPIPKHACCPQPPPKQEKKAPAPKSVPPCCQLDTGNPALPPVPQLSFSPWVALELIPAPEPVSVPQAAAIQTAVQIPWQTDNSPPPTPADPYLGRAPPVA